MKKTIELLYKYKEELNIRFFDDSIYEFTKTLIESHKNLRSVNMKNAGAIKKEIKEVKSKLREEIENEEYINIDKLRKMTIEDFISIFDARE